MRLKLSIGSVTILVGVVSAVAGVVGETSTGEPPIVTAEFHPGGTSDSFGWRVSVSSDGRIKQEVKTEPRWNAPNQWTTRPVESVSAKKLARFLRTTAKVGLCGLEPKYSATYQISESPESWRVVTDQDKLVLSVDHDDMQCRVEVYGAERITGIWKSNHEHPKREEVRRFCRAWAGLLTLAPAPNDWQKARLYR